MISQALEQITRAFYARADLELILSSPASPRRIFAVRIAAIGLATAAMACVLAGPFIEAWVKSRGGTNAAKTEARQRFVGPLHDHLSRAGLGHVSEIADGEAPHTPRGCPFQAWSLAELIRLEHDVLALGRPGRLMALSSRLAGS